MSAANVVFITWKCPPIRWALFFGSFIDTFENI